MEDNEMDNIDEKRIKNMDNIITILKKLKKMKEKDNKKKEQKPTLIKKLEILNKNKFLKTCENLKGINDKRDNLLTENNFLIKKKNDLNKKLKNLKLEYIQKLTNKKKENFLLKEKEIIEKEKIKNKIEEEIKKNKKIKMENLIECNTENENKNLEEIFILQNLICDRLSLQIKNICLVECKLKKNLLIKKSIFLNIILVIKNINESLLNFDINIEGDKTIEILIKNYLSNKINFDLKKHEMIKIKILVQPKKIIYNVPKINFIVKKNNFDIIFTKKYFLPILINHFIQISKKNILLKNSKNNFIKNKISVIINQKKFNKNISFFKLFFPINEIYYCKYLTLFTFEIKGVFFKDKNLYELEICLPYEYSFYFEQLKNQYSFFFKIITN